jgi:hypothetical protein
MNFGSIKIVAYPEIRETYCECGTELKEVSNGWFESALFCSKCENVYLLALKKVKKDKLDEKFLTQCRNRIKNESRP